MSSFLIPTLPGRALLDTFFRGYLDELNDKIGKQRSSINEMLARDSIPVGEVATATDTLKRLVEQRNAGNAIVTDRLYVHDTYRLSMLMGDMVMKDVGDADLIAYADSASTVPAATAESADPEPTFHDQATDLIREFATLASPKLPLPDRTRLDTIIEELQQLYVETFGDPDGPEVYDRLKTMVFESHANLVKAALR